MRGIGQNGAECESGCPQLAHFLGELIRHLIARLRAVHVAGAHILSGHCARRRQRLRSTQPVEVECAHPGTSGQSSHVGSRHVFQLRLAPQLLERAPPSPFRVRPNVPSEH
eukprot:3933909-Rhodomonas_salina.2